MPIRYNLTSELRIKLKQPLGTLIRGSFNETTKRLVTMVDEERPPCIISVGDTVSKNLAKGHIPTNVSIIDNRCMRRKTDPSELETEKTLYVKNPQATITEEAISAIHEAILSGRLTKIVVEGEEDLLALIAIIDAPQNSFIVYGQPLEGIVVVKATESKKSEVSEILKAMENGSKH